VDYQQEIARRESAAAVYRYRSASVSDVEAARLAQVTHRLKGAFELLGEASDRLEALHAILDAKTYTTPSMAHDAQRLRAAAGLIAETLPLQYALG